LGRAEDGKRAAPDQPTRALPRQSLPDFERLSELGWEIVQARLLRQLPRKGLAKHPGKGDHAIRGRALLAAGTRDRDQQHAVF
jgi:hypothetical protein